KNDAEFDFDAEKRQREEEARRQEEAARKGLTVGQWARRYFDVLAPSLDKRSRTIEREAELWAKLEPHFGSLALSDIKLSVIASYRVEREEQVSFVTCNRELGFIRYLMNLALEEGVIEAAPKIRLKSERGRVRTRILTADEYSSILKRMGREQERY